MQVAVASHPVRGVTLAAQTLLLSAIIAASAHISVPFWPVPMTLQTGAVLAIGACCGWRLGLAAMVAYLVEGLLGLPVFASGAGPAVLIGPTAGYLVGMLVAVGIVGLARTASERAWAMLLGTVAIYTLGAGWLGHLIGVDKAITLGVVPFLLGDAVKAALAWALSLKFNRG